MYLSRDEELLKLMNKLNLIKENLDIMKSELCKSESNMEKNRYNELIKYIENQVYINIQSVDELKKPFLLFIVGSGNYGKSTLINVLLKDDIIETTDLPNTWKLDLFIKSSEEKMEIIYKNNTKIIQNLEEGNKTLKEEEIKYKNSKKKIAEELKEYKKLKNLDIYNLKKYKNILEEKHLYKSDVVEVDYYIKKNEILKDFIIVDTPGINQDLIKDTENRMKSYYKRADGVIWLVDAQNIVSRINNELMIEINEIDKFHGKNKNIIAVVNKMDIIEQSGQENLEKVKSRAKEIYKKYFDDIIFISAKQGINGIINKNENLIKNSNIEKLYKSIDENFKKKAEESQIKSKYQNLSIMKYNITRVIEDYKRNLYKDISKYNEAEFQLKSKTKEFRIYSVAQLDNLKNKNYLKEDIELIKLQEDIKSMEIIFNKSLKEIYKSLYTISSFNENKLQEDIELKVVLAKSKYIIIDYSTREALTFQNNKSTYKKEGILNKLTTINSKSKFYDEYFMKDIILKKIQGLSEEINEILDDKLNIINKNINKVREESFKELYLDYKNLNKHIVYLDNIENILKKMG